MLAPKKLFIGLMSGTSMDGVDAVLVDFNSHTPSLLTAHQEPIPDDLQQRLRQLAQPGDDGVDQLGTADIQVGRLFARAVHHLLKSAKTAPEDVVAIGSHGQTVRHRPDSDTPFTLQIGDPNTLAHLTGITTVADFRRRDMAAGGEGAPLVPAIHAHLFRHTAFSRAILNIGGIANITLLPAASKARITGYDTGPGNTLMDYWSRQHLGKAFDNNGEWAAKGRIAQPLLELMLSDPYFTRQPPKSSGPEYFSPRWLQQHLASQPLAAEDVQATLLALTSHSICRAIQQHDIDIKEVLVCGGGVHNRQLMQQLAAQLKPIKLESTATAGVDPDWLEALAFAWLAKRTLNRESGNLPDVTGADRAVILGGIYPA
ncbi:MAG: anhydro-N-acetylmuramic acid kinase [Candidatus Polarisedimenticolaceae bacterium]|nr:anhydro-N-acetylmuramic acid kinase [Candidatus Polarisedimenticolaceae bacterium]